MKYLHRAAALVMGGFHLQGTSPETVDDIVANLREYGVRQVSPTHCTGDGPIRKFAAEYGQDYLEGGVGRVFVVGAEPPPGNGTGPAAPPTLLGWRPMANAGSLPPGKAA